MADPTAQPAQASLTAYGGVSELRFLFPRNPTKTGRSAGANYTEVALAGEDLHPESSGPEPFEWVRNTAEEISVEFTLHKDSTDDDVEAEIKTLDDMRRKDSRTGEPPRLIYRYGQRADLVVLASKRVTERLYTRDGRCRWAEVSLTMKVIRPRF